MSLVEIYISSGSLTDEKKGELSRKVTDLIFQETGKPYPIVIIHEIPADNWMIDKKKLSEIKGK